MPCTVFFKSGVPSFEVFRVVCVGIANLVSVKWSLFREKSGSRLFNKDLEQSGSNSRLFHGVFLTNSRLSSEEVLDTLERYG